MVPNTLLTNSVYMHSFSIKPHSVPVEHMHASLNMALADSTRTAQLKSSSVSAPQYKSTELPSSATSAGDDNMYEHMELKPSTEQGPTAQYEDVMELSSNVAYGKVQR